MFREAISAIGNKILRGDTRVLSISLPVAIFRKESHLQTIARNLSFCPLLFERPSSPLERVKLATLFAISVGTLGISMEKPFAPLLGETLQAWIDGCPVYLEQVSQCPPITAYQLMGRGYSLHGMIEPKMSLGMNSIKGASDRPNYLVFDDGTLIELLFGKMVIYGTLFG
jgi:hypothetical protein